MMLWNAPIASELLTPDVPYSEIRMGSAKIPGMTEDFSSSAVSGAIADIDQPWAAPAKAGMPFSSHWAASFSLRSKLPSSRASTKS